MNKRRIVIFVFLIANCLLLSQNLEYDHLTTDNGLSNNAVYSIAQGKLGFMWFGTNVGLNRFDGYNFITWQDDFENSNLVSMQSTGNIMIDSEGTIWIGSWGGGLIKFDPEKNSVKQFLNNSNDPVSISGNRVQSLFQDSKGRYWFGTYANGLNLFDAETEQFFHYNYSLNNENSLSNDRIWAIAEGPDADIWIATSLGLNKLNPETGEIITFFHNPDDPNSLIDNRLRNLFVHNDLLWISTTDGFCSYSFIDSTFHRFNKVNLKDLKGEKINQIYCSQNDAALWVGTIRGLNRYKISGRNLISNPFQDIQGDLENQFIRSICEDENGNTWFGTNDNGIFKINVHRRKFNRISDFFKGKLSGNKILAIEEDDVGNLWIGTNGGGLNKVNFNSGNITVFKHDPDNLNSLSNNEVNALLFENNNLWIGTQTGLDKLDLNSNAFSHFQIEGLKEIKSLAKDSYGIIWIGTYNNGLYLYQKRNAEFTHFEHHAFAENSLSHQEVWTVHVDHQNEVWIGTGKGLDYFNRADNSFIHYQSDPENEQSLKGFRVLSIYGEPTGILWVGTEEGLNKLDFSKNRNEPVYSQYSSQEGLAGTKVESILRDDNGNIWLATNQGISKLNSSENRFSNYDVDDGLQGQEFYSNAKCKGKDGRFYFGGSNGLNLFFPNQIKDNTKLPKVVLCSFKKIGNPTTTLNYVNYLKKISLSYKDRIFSFEFSALDFIAPEMNHYAYQMVGLDNEWIYSNYKNRKITFTGLQPGNYIFHVKASNSDGYWNEKGTSIKVKIIPPLWKTWWAYSLYVIIIIACGYGIYYWRTKEHRNRKKELKIKIRNRTAELLEAKNKTEAILKASTNGIITINQYGELESFNPAAEKIFGYTRQEVIGKNVSMFMPEEHAKKHDQYIQNYLDTGIKKVIDKKMEVIAKRRTGELFPIEIGISEVDLKNTKLFTAVLSDITERKTMEINLNQKLDELQRLDRLDVGRKIKMIELKILMQFRKNIHNFSKDILVAVKEKNQEQAVRIVHVLKDAAGNLGAEELFNSAESLEYLLKENLYNKNEIQKNLDNISNQIESIFQKIEIYHINDEQEVDTESNNLDLKRVRSLISQLERNLAEYSTESTETFKKIKNLIRNYGMNLNLRDLEKQIYDYDFESALMHLSEFKKTIEKMESL